MNFLELDFWRIIGVRVEEDTPVVVEVGFHNHSVQRRDYRGGRTGHGSRGEPFLVEFQVPK